MRALSGIPLSARIVHWQRDEAKYEQERERGTRERNYTPYTGNIIVYLTSTQKYLWCGQRVTAFRNPLSSLAYYRFLMIEME